MSKQDVSKQDLVDMFEEDGEGLGLDEESSDVLIRNLNTGTVPLAQGSPFTADEEDTDDFRIVEFGFDSSRSMAPVEKSLIECFNKVIIAGLLDGAAEAVGAIRIGGLKFGTIVTPLWDEGFHPIRELPQLSSNEYRAEGMTALNQGVLDMMTAATGHALTIKGRTGTYPEIVLACLSDGANNQDPQEPDEVRKVMDKLSNELFTKVFIGFETGERDYRTQEPIDFRVVAESLGFRDILESKAEPGETLVDQQRRFRNIMRVFSLSMDDRLSSPKLDDQPDGGTGFWAADDDDE